MVPGWRAHGPQLMDALVAFGLSWIELSRHHPLQERNDAIMLFRPDAPIADVPAFVQTARRLAARLPLRWVCLVQRGGVDNADAIAQYIACARSCGASQVIFREVSRLDDAYRSNGTLRYIGEHRVGVDTLLDERMQQPWWSRWQPDGLTEGDYFWNVRLRDDAGLQVVFESAADAAMHTRHASGDLYKLVFFAMPVCVRAGMRLPMCCGNPPMDEFDQRSWWTPTLDDAAWVLPADLRAADPLNGRDCGWFNQMRPFVRHFSRPGEQVFDPFCGFGSTLPAAALEGRNAHGMEIDPARAQLTRARLQQHAAVAPSGGRQPGRYGARCAARPVPDQRAVFRLALAGRRVARPALRQWRLRQLSERHACGVPCAAQANAS